jgi:hypothetical protein
MAEILKRSSAVTWAVVAASILGTCCTYSLTGNLPGHIRSVQVQSFRSAATEYGLDRELTARVTEMLVKDGRLAVTYGFRGRPTALCAKLSSDKGKTWSEPVILRRGSRNWDFGYSRSLQKDEGNVVTVYYWATPEHRNQYIAATIWNPEKVDADM